MLWDLVNGRMQKIIWISERERVIDKWCKVHNVRLRNLLLSLHPFVYIYIYIYIYKYIYKYIYITRARARVCVCVCLPVCMVLFAL